jgi:hypothetical protein
MGTIGAIESQVLAQILGRTDLKDDSELHLPHEVRRCGNPGRDSLFAYEMVPIAGSWIGGFNCNVYYNWAKSSLWRGNGGRNHGEWCFDIYGS